MKTDVEKSVTTSDGWVFRLDPVVSKDRRRKHYVFLRFLARQDVAPLNAFRCGLMCTNKASVKTWTRQLRAFANRVDRYVDKEMRDGL